MSSIHKMRTSICNTLGLQKVVCPYKGLLSEEKMTGTLYPKENGCDNRVVVLTRSSCEGVPLYYVIPVRHVRQDIFSVEDFGVLKSCFSYFIHFCYSCMLQLHAKDPSLRVHGIKDLGAFVHRTLSVTYVHLNIIHIWKEVKLHFCSRPGYSAPNYKTTIKSFYKKKVIHFALLDLFDFFKKPYICQ